MRIGKKIPLLQLIIILVFMVFAGCSEGAPSSQQQPQEVKPCGILHWPEGSSSIRLENNEVSMLEYVFYGKDVNKALLGKVGYVLALEAGVSLTEEEQNNAAQKGQGKLKIDYETALNVDGETVDPQAMAMTLYGISLEEYIEVFIQDELVNKYKNILYEELSGNCKDEDVEKYYLENSGKYDTVTFRMIMLDASDPVTGLEQVRTMALGIAETIVDDESMSQAVVQYSDEPGKGDTGGLRTCYVDPDSADVLTKFASREDIIPGFMDVFDDGRYVYICRCVFVDDYYTSASVKIKVTEDFLKMTVDQKISDSIPDHTIYVPATEEPSLPTPEISPAPGVTQIPVTPTPVPTPAPTPIPDISAEDKSDPVAVAVSHLSKIENASNVFVALRTNGAEGVFYAYSIENRKVVEKFQQICYLGYNGTASPADKREGDGRTPQGFYKLSLPFGIKDDPGCKLPGYLKVGEDDWWDSDSSSPTYNKLVKGSEMPDSWNRNVSEQLIKYVPSYNYGAFIEYNCDPIVPGKGSAIFLHCYGNGKTTNGCVGIPEEYMIKTLQMLDETSYIVIVDQISQIYNY